jgi:hypothetical protein
VSRVSEDHDVKIQPLLAPGPVRSRFYDTDLTNAAWVWVAPVLPAARPGALLLGGLSALSPRIRTIIAYASHQSRKLGAARCSDPIDRRNVETCRRLKVPVRDYLASVLPGLLNFPINRVAFEALHSDKKSEDKG